MKWTKIDGSTHGQTTVLEILLQLLLCQRALTLSVQHLACHEQDWRGKLIDVARVPESQTKETDIHVFHKQCSFVRERGVFI
jgi:hypothetical protein